MKNRVIYALHGFLGLPSDWNILPPEILEEDEIVPISLFQENSCPIKSGLVNWAKSFNDSVKTQSPQKKRVLMGYSLGGRLAMHALLQDPTMWSGAILISSHTGLTKESDRKSRLVNDLNWAQRFENESWESLMHSWNSQGVFAGVPSSIHRNEKDYQRSVLADILRYFSLGMQNDLSLPLLQLPFPILWMAGELDSTYANLIKMHSIKNPSSRMSMIEKAGHRAPWEQPEAFQQHLKNFLKF